MADSFVASVAIDNQDNKWFGTYGFYNDLINDLIHGGVSKFDGKEWTTYITSNSGLVVNGINAIAIDAQDNKWFGTNHGVSKFDNTRWTTYTTASGLVSDYVWVIEIDKQGNIWFGTTDGGVSKFDGKEWTTYNTSNSGLVDNGIKAIAIDAQDNKWFGTIHGVSKFDNTG